MIADSGDPARFNTGTMSLIRSYADEIAAMPDGPFHAYELEADGVRLAFSKLRQTEALQIYQHARDRERKKRCQWRVHPTAREYAERVSTHRDAICPCGHSGVRNRGDHYRCGAGHCDQEFSREDLEVDA